ncbi:7000_t:CDS:2, partial [Funneliformis caledonium]
MQDGMKRGPALILANFAKKCKEKKLRAFSTYRSLKEVLAKYNISGNDIGTIRQFPPVTYKLEDDDKKLQQYIREIKRKLELYLLIAMKPYTLEVVGKESISQVEYTIKTLKELICIMKGKLHQVTMGF